MKTTGDGLLAEFSNVVDALRCATQWQHRVAEGNAGIAAEKRIEFRLGVYQGDIIVGDDNIFGEEVNVAARLEGMAEPGGICVPARVQEDVAGARVAAVVKARNTSMTATVPIARIAPFRRLWIETSI